MSPRRQLEPCPFCDQPIPSDAERCRYCGEYVYEDDYDRPIRRPRHSVEATDFLVPTNVSGWSIAACYMGLVGLLLPFLGLIFAIPALVCGIVALQKRRTTGTYGAVTSDIRAVLGIVFSVLAMMLWGALFILILSRK